MTKDPSERLTTRQVSQEFNIAEGTLGSWRYRRRHDPRLPRYHKLITGTVFYILHEIEADLQNMELEIGVMER